MRDQFVPKMSYTYTYTSPAKYRHPIIWSTTVSEAGNILSLGYLCTGKKWNDEDKEMFRNPYSQFLKLETDFVKYWRIAEHSTLVGHLNAGVVWSYGNSEKALITSSSTLAVPTVCVLSMCEALVPAVSAYRQQVFLYRPDRRH